MTTTLGRTLSVEEYPLVFGARRDLFGIVSLPVGSIPTVCLIHYQAGGLPATNHNRTWVTFGRQWAGLGYGAVRFDYHGVGESGGEFFMPDMSSVDPNDLLDALIATRAQFDFKYFVIVASCFGGGPAIEVARRYPEVLGLVFLSVPLTARVRSAEGETTVPTEVARWITEEGARLPERNLPSLFVYGHRDGYYDQFVAAQGSLRGGLDCITSALLEGKLRGLTSIAIQRDAFDVISKWLVTASPVRTGL